MRSDEIAKIVTEFFSRLVSMTLALLIAAALLALYVRWEVSNVVDKVNHELKSIGAKK
jgi:hypothetical protein